MGKVGEDAPVTLLVGIGHRAAGHGLADAAVVELGTDGPQTGGDVAQTLAVGELRKGQHQKLLVGGQRTDAAVAVIAADTPVKLILGQLVQQLGEHGSALVYAGSSPRLGGDQP